MHCRGAADLRDPILSPTRPDAASDPATNLRRELAAMRLRYANLLAATRATLAAVRDGDSYALEFLADELVVQHGQDDLARREVGR